MPKTKNICWTTPASMIASLIAGVVFALAHHVLYSRLAGTTVEAGNYRIAGYNVSQQQINTASGTALAFLAKVCLVLAISIAYTQAFWRAVGRSQTKLSSLDTISSVLNNIWSFLKVQVWWKYPLLLLLAFSIWLIPIASVITPATLSVIVAPTAPAPQSLAHVPQADFTSLKLISPGVMIGHSYDPAMVYNGPDLIVQRIAQSVSSSGSILPISPPKANASWQLDFTGPYLKCNDINDTLRHEIQKNILLPYRNGSYCQNYYNFLSWTATPGNTPGAQNRATDPFANSPMPFATKKPFDLHTGTLGPLDFAGFEADLSTNTSQVATIYFAAMPNFKALTLGECPLGTLSTSHQNLSTNFDGSTFVQCQLHATTYHTDFDYNATTQSISTSFSDLERSTPVDTLAGFFFNDGEKGCATINTVNKSCVVDPATLERLSYQAIMDAFGRVMVGSVHNGDTRDHSTYVISTRILSTILAITDELLFLSKDTSWTHAGHGLFQTSSKEVTSLYSNSNATLPPRPLKATLEQLFQNITISMFSSLALQANESSPFAPPPVNVTFHDYAPTYVYAVKTLWLAYGIAIFIALIGVSIGIFCIVSTGASFSNDFSTVLRAARSASLSVEVRDADGDGKDPLPRYLDDAEVGFEGGIWHQISRQSSEQSGMNAKGGFRMFQRSG